jgi:hypothetical protein
MSDIHSHKENKEVLREAIFKSTYIATFLATYMAGRYDNDCANGHPGSAYLHQPVEDASFNANCAWNTIQEQL